MEKVYEIVLFVLHYYYAPNNLAGCNFNPIKELYPTSNAEMSPILAVSYQTKLKKLDMKELENIMHGMKPKREEMIKFIIETEELEYRSSNVV